MIPKTSEYFRPPQYEATRKRGDNQFLSIGFVSRLHSYLNDFLVELDHVLDKRLEIQYWEKAHGQYLDPRCPRKTRCQLKMLFLPVTHPDWPEQSLFLVISRQGMGRPPRYLLTHLELTSHQQAWEVIFSHARRWKIEQTSRFAKSEMALESPKLWFWNNRLKCMALLSLAMDFLLHLLQQGRTSDTKELLNQWCPRIRNRCREAATPIY